MEERRQVWGEGRIYVSHGKREVREGNKEKERRKANECVKEG